MDELDGWCEGGLSQQRNDGGGCATMRERSERVVSPGTYVTESVSRDQFCLAMCSFGPPSRAQGPDTPNHLRIPYLMEIEFTTTGAPKCGVRT